jgi:predicted AAA+ superfamily ATPase
MEIKRDIHLQRLMSRMHNQMIKVITGVRRCGKSYLLFNLFFDALKQQGVDEQHIIRVNLEDRRNHSLRDPDALLAFIDSRLTDSKMHYILLDEIQLVQEFEDVLNSYLHVPNADVYVTGSNAKFLSKDVITEFRGRGDEVRIRPLSFGEISAAFPTLSAEEILRQYMLYGGLPQVVTMDSDEQKREYLLNLFTHTYLRDIKQRNHIRLEAELDELISILASSIGGLTNPHKLYNTFRSIKQSSISQETIRDYLEHLQDAFLIEHAVRYDIKGKHYIDTPAKYYFEDLGLRNAKINFRQTEQTHLMENLIYNELRLRGYAVDVGVIEKFVRNTDGTNSRSYLEVDFVCNKGYDRVYVQSAYALPSEEKREQELRSLKMIDDSFQKVVIVAGLQPTYRNDDGILILNLLDFLNGRIVI